MADFPPVSSPPVVAIIGGAGAMGRFFAERLGPAVRWLLLADQFSDSADRSRRLDRVLSALGAWSARSSFDSAVCRVAIDPATSAILGFDEDPSSRKALTIQVSTSRSVDANFLRDQISGQIGQPLPAALERLTTQEAVQRVSILADLQLAVLLMPNVQVTLLAFGFENADDFARALDPYVSSLAPGSLVADVSSQKAEPMRVMARAIPPNVGVLGTHPLFGPSVSDLTGLIMAVVEPEDSRIRSIWQDWLLNQFASWKLLVAPSSARGHDDAMAYVQTLSHFALLTFAYTFVRLDQDPADLLALRTPIFEPLLYLAARVASLARNTPETYRQIQTHASRPDVRTTFIETARDLLAAIEDATRAEAVADPSERAKLDQPLRAFLNDLGAPWTADGKERRDRERREHLFEMGRTLVDHVNRLRQEIVARRGLVCAVEERRPGQSPRIVIGEVQLDPLRPGKQDVATRVRLRKVNLGLGVVEGNDDSSDSGVVSIPLAYVRFLGDEETRSWLVEANQLTERRSLLLQTPRWFDDEVLDRLLRGFHSDDNQARVWSVRRGVREPAGVEPISDQHQALGEDSVYPIDLTIVVEPAAVVGFRRSVAARPSDADREIAETERALELLRRNEHELPKNERQALSRTKDELKKRRKQAIDQRNTRLDRAVRSRIRAVVATLERDVTDWLCAHGCRRVELGR